MRFQRKPSLDVIAQRAGLLLDAKAGNYIAPEESVKLSAMGFQVLQRAERRLFDKPGLEGESNADAIAIVQELRADEERVWE